MATKQVISPEVLKALEQARKDQTAPSTGNRMIQEQMKKPDGEKVPK